MNTLKKATHSLVKKGDLFIAKNGVKKFHLEASSLLEHSKIQNIFDYKELTQLVFESEFNKLKQNFASLEFSDLPITVARGKHCFIDLYFWRRRPTVIHNHHFTGAFQCIEGSNVDLEFSFKEKRKIGKFHAMGEVKIEKSHVVKSGDIQPIAPLDKFIHQNHHHSDLTINLCFRTSDIEKNHLSNYLYSGLRYEKNPLLLSRVERLLRFAQIQEFDYKKLDLTIDDAIGFLIRTDGIDTQNKVFIELREYLAKKVKKEADLNITKLFDLHEVEINKLEEEYD